MSARSQSGYEAVGAIVALFVFLLPLRSWALMLALGIVHAEVVDAVTPIGWWTSFLLTLLVRCALTSGNSSPKKDTQ